MQRKFSVHLLFGTGQEDMLSGPATKVVANIIDKSSMYI